MVSAKEFWGFVDITDYLQFIPFMIIPSFYFITLPIVLAYLRDAH